MKTMDWRGDVRLSRLRTRSDPELEFDAVVSQWRGGSMAVREAIFSYPEQTCNVGVSGRVCGVFKQSDKHLNIGERPNCN